MGAKKEKDFWIREVFLAINFKNYKGVNDMMRAR